jgi:hypothetical protein
MLFISSVIAGQIIMGNPASMCAMEWFIRTNA